ncbi:TolC family protein [Geobacter argillaceus]|uniref:Cobalt-zinc-cadmium efflux system outer membrane protein n=1 Tax=Geobacter argillaceus TaxID=345631 RepID=A0A562VLX3_9BACT|nr:TolC family protein [Geobacter argillaceus]TWJ18832.1 cobalt-zinc-cadmium efflux system outer membrane protein [Geobacter argillaceus]
MILIKQWKSILFLVTAILLLVLPLSVRAETDDIPLERAVEEFYRNNYDILINRYEIDKAQADFIGARLLPNPNLSLNYTGADPKIPPTATDSSQFTIRLDQLFELGGKRELRSRNARETLEAARLLHKDTIRTLLTGFYTLCYNLELDLLNRDAARNELARFDRTLAIAEKRFNAGHLSQVDYTKITLARIDLETNLTNLETQLKNDSELFAFLIGRDRAHKPNIALGEEFPAYREEELAARAYDNRYDYLALKKQLEAAGSNRSLARAGRIPDITVGAEFETFGRQNTPGIGVGISLPLPLFNRNQGDIQRRSAEYAQIERQLDKAKRQIVSDIRQSLNNLAGAVQVLTGYRTRRVDVEALRERSEKAFTLGGITALDLLDTEKGYRDFITKYNQALVQSNLNGQLVKIATGELK